MAKNVAVLFSGAKDSTFAIYKAMGMGLNVKFLVTIIPKSDESYMFHHPNVRWTRLHAEAMGIPLVTKETEGREGTEIEDLKEVISSLRPEIDGVVSGALASRYQKARIDALCKQLGLESISPHWERGMKEYLEELLFLGFDIIMSAVAAEGLDQSWLGRRLDSKTIADLEKLNRKHGIHMGGEGGEYESFVLDAPMFRKKISIIRAHKEWDGARGFFIIDDARLVDKSA
jgi:ABC transporter with metal-binding/Fe-S-binding domain ATP-binding protein